MDLTKLIEELLSKSITVGIVTLAGGLLGLTRVLIEILIAVNRRFDHAEAMMLGEVNLIKARQQAMITALGQIALALMRIDDVELKKLLLNITEDLQEEGEKK